MLKFNEFDKFQKSIFKWVKNSPHQTRESLHANDQLSKDLNDSVTESKDSIALIIGGAKSGKTTSYLVALSDLVNSERYGIDSNGCMRDEYRKKMINMARLNPRSKCGGMHKIKGLPKLDWNGLLVPLAIILVPHRELGMRIFDFCSRHQLRSKLLAGGKGYKKQSAFQDGTIRVVTDKKLGNVDVVIATPDLLYRALHAEYDHVRIDVRYLKYMIVEDAEMVLETDFRNQLNNIYKIIGSQNLRQAYIASTHHTNLWGCIGQVCNDSQVHGLEIHNSESDKIHDDVHQVFTAIAQSDPLQQLLETLDELGIKVNATSGKRVVIFCNTSKCCRFVMWSLRERGFKVTSLHAELGYEQRTKALTDFGNTCDILVATNMASRGQIAQIVNDVINFNFPKNVTQYMQRVSTISPSLPTKSPRVITFFSRRNLPMLKDIQRLSHIRNKVEFQNTSPRVAKILERYRHLQTRRPRRYGIGKPTKKVRRNVLSVANKMAMKKIYLRDRAIKRVQFLRKRGILKRNHGLPKFVAFTKFACTAINATLSHIVKRNLSNLGNLENFHQIKIINPEPRALKAASSLHFCDAFKVPKFKCVDHLQSIFEFQLKNKSRKLAIRKMKRRLGERISLRYK
ncbi:bifunctional Helicase [Babesia duncani]|uniref:RNA helicase n=1 Tax=Babesia duncani TaxID=323732 RepID=A0AAD9PMQ0_9APIC|nr:bifunctional Helicase [Babesia duncani]